MSVHVSISAGCLHITTLAGTTSICNFTAQGFSKVGIDAVAGLQTARRDFGSLVAGQIASRHESGLDERMEKPCAATGCFQ
jgi:hypothetical protein